MITYDYTQRDWGFTAPNGALKPNRPTVMEIHHDVYPKSAGWDEITHARKIDAQHRGMGWKCVFYNVGVDSVTGKTVELRGWGYESTPEARDALTVVVFGDLRVDALSLEAKTSLWRISQQFAAGAVRGHQERPYATACPGANGLVFARELREGWTPPPKAVGGVVGADPLEDDMTLVWDADRNAWWLAGPSGVVRVLTWDRVLFWKDFQKKPVWVVDAATFDATCASRVVAASL